MLRSFGLANKHRRFGESLHTPNLGLMSPRRIMVTV